jgi:hypothetical protein
MSSWILPFAVMAVLVLATAIVSWFALVRAGLACKAATELNQDGWRAAEAKIAQLQANVDNLAAQFAASAAQPALAGPVRPAMNLNKRSQALRLHRRGDPPEAIAASLGLPVQEVDLLIKVHRIVLSSL